MTPKTMRDRSPDRILVVDDEPEILIALEDLLAEDYQVLTAGSPEEGLALLAREPEIAVIVSDQRMPGMTGDAFLARAREISAAEALLLTGYADLEAVIRAVNNGRIAGYAPKPWEPTALRSLIAGACERYRLARALETERRLLQGLLDNSADALSFKDAEGRFLRLNAVKAAALGASVAECLGRREAEFLPPAEARALAEAEAEAIAAGAPTERRDERRGDERAPRWFDVNRIPIRGQGGATEFLVTIEREVTEARLLEARLRQADKMQALGTLAGGVAHDFNNLLTAILGSLRMAVRGDLEKDRLERLIRNALAAAERGAALTQRLLSFSRNRTLSLRPTEVNRLLAGMEDLLARTLGGMVRVRRELDPALWPALVDPDELELAVLNLCVNARDAMPEGGVVCLATRNATVPDGTEAPDPAPGEYVVISVRDTGAGMPPEVLERAFEPFFTTKEVGKGTGLGLPMVYGMARQSGGTVRIASTPGQGTEVELYLPRSPEPAAVPEAPRSPARPARPARILVVDDEPAVREVTAGFLRELGHAVLEADSAAAALRMVEEGAALDLVVTDLAMPEVSGLDLALRLRALRPPLPVLLITGYLDLDRVPEGIPVLHKPFRQHELARRVAELTAAPR
ncbi:response regulator [Crenalkalicoccus roseus]|uniref:response regulator n=1 Tax=Crenalkalicoccus roseus TaxID=1485588 RepID=UPI0010803DBB|nr:response regulator [Crenalkalicoccus roseus]